MKLPFFKKSFQEPDETKNFTEWPKEKLTPVAAELYRFAMLALQAPNRMMVSPGSKPSLELTQYLNEASSRLSTDLEKAQVLASLREKVQASLEEYGNWQSKEVDRLSDDLLCALEGVVASIKESLSESAGVTYQIQDVQTGLRKAQTAETIEEMRAVVNEQTTRIQNVVVRQGQIQQALNKKFEDSVKVLEDQLKASEESGRTDHLTRVPNRGAFEQQLEQAFHNFQRKGTQTCLAITDLNKFKVINDTLGHAAGDACLKAFAAELKSVFNNVAFYARLGGDEFAILYSGSANEFDRLIKQVQIGLVKKPVRTDPKNPNESVTLACSYGIATLREGDTSESLYQRADSEMYNMKKATGGLRDSAA